MTHAAVELENLRKSFTVKTGKGFRRVATEIQAVDGISLGVDSGESIAFIGPNGAGKSTTIKILTGILRPSSGSVRVLGLTPWSQRSKLAGSIGAVFGQRSQLWYHLPPSDTFELLSKIYELPRQDYVRRRDLLIEKFDIGPFLTTPVRKLSLGQRMRAEVAASLLHRPKLLLLDEPTIGLDVMARQDLRDLIREWNREEGLTVFLTSHDAGDIESVARRVVVVNHGRIVLDDTVSDMRRQYLGAKVVGVKFSNTPERFELAGVSVIESSQHALKLEVDTTAVPVEKVLEAVLRCGNVADITIEDPPLEEVIAHIYSRPKEADVESSRNSVEEIRSEILPLTRPGENDGGVA